MGEFSEILKAQKLEGQTYGEGIATRVLREISEQREEITRAFVAKHGFGSDMAVQVTETTLNGMKWYIRQKTEEEREESRQTFGASAPPVRELLQKAMSAIFEAEQAIRKE